MSAHPIVVSAAVTEVAISRGSWDELEAAGMCECGQALANHAPMPKLRPIESWHAETSGRRLVALGFGTEEGLAQATALRARRARVPRPTDVAPAGAAGDSGVSSRTSGRTRGTAPRSPARPSS
jgi:hypothetical protein